MKNLLLLALLSFIGVSCSGGSEDITEFDTAPRINNEFQWIVPEGLVNGSDSPFPLAKDPVLIEARNINFLANQSLVAAVNIKGVLKIYPYVYLNNFESVNDAINDDSFALTYCPLTQSALLINRDHKSDNFVLRASGYLLYDNVILKDANSDTYWSQMLGQCIKGSYAGDLNATFNFVEMTWGTVKANFPEALVFTNSSVSISSINENANKADVKVGDLVYGILGTSQRQQPFGSSDGKATRVYIYHYDDFGTTTTLKSVIIANKKTLVIGNKNDHYITSYINDSKAEFEAVQNRFPIVMKDSDDNEWDVFGIAVNGPRKGEQLASHTGFFALFWAWENFYTNFTFDE